MNDKSKTYRQLLITAVAQLQYIYGIGCKGPITDAERQRCEDRARVFVKRAEPIACESNA